MKGELFNMSQTRDKEKKKEKKRKNLIPLSLLMVTSTVPDVSSMQDTCHKNSVKWSCSLCVLSYLSLYGTHPVFGKSWVRYLSGTQIFPLSHACDMLSNSPFTFHIHCFTPLRTCLPTTQVYQQETTIPP